MGTAFFLAITILMWGSYHNFVRLGSQHLSAAAMQFVSALCWGIITPLYFFLIQKTPVKWNVAGIGWSVAAFLAANIGGFAYMHAVSKIEVSKAVVISTSYPALTVLIAILFMGEHLTWQKVVGFLLVGAGVIVSSR